MFIYFPLIQLCGKGFWYVLSNAYTHKTYMFKKHYFLNGLICNGRKIYAFAELIVFQQGAIEHTYKLMACLFTSISQWGVMVQQQKYSKTSVIWEATSVYAQSADVRKTPQMCPKAAVQQRQCHAGDSEYWKYSTHPLALVMMWKFGKKCWSTRLLSYLSNSSFLFS